MFCEVTEASLRAFQRDHGLVDHGICDEPTWLALVDASWRLGDRTLRLDAPHQRGEDVASLQAMLARLGFDTGKVDGIFGPDTARALADFQRNCGLVDDAVCGPLSVRALEVNAAHTGTGPGVATLRELVQLDRVTTPGQALHGLRVALGQFGGLGPLTRQLSQHLRAVHANVLVIDRTEASAHAAAANRYDAAVYVGFDARSVPSARVTYYAAPAYESPGGRSLAAQLAARFPAWSDAEPETAGGRFPVLRETRMPAVVCALGPVQHVIDDAVLVTDAVISALVAWVTTPRPTTEPGGAP